MEEAVGEMDNPVTTVDATTNHNDGDELTAEEKKEADITPVPQCKEDVPINHDEVADNETSSNPPLPSVVSGSSIMTFKFSYEPRDYEQEYYDNLFYHVVSTSNIPIAAADKPKEEIVVSPKEAAKLLYTSGVPPERLRMIWNMATLPSTPLPPGANPPPAMTNGQFRVAVRLIQLFQNRVAAVDEQLNVSDEARTVYSGSEGGFVLNKSDRLAPAYFNGVSGEIIPLPKNIETIKTNGVSPSKSNGLTRQVKRRSSKTSLSSLSINEEKTPSNGRTNAPQPMPLAEMEREIRRLSTMVSTLQGEVEELKRGNVYAPRNNIADEDPSVGVEIYWGQRKVKEISPDERISTPNELPLKAKVSTRSINSKSFVPTPPQFAAMNNRRINVSRNRLSQSQNIPTTHPSISRRAKGNLGVSTPGGAVGTDVQVSRQPMKIPEDGVSLTSQMQAVRREEEFNALLGHAKERMEGDGGSNAGSRKSNRSGSFRPVRLNQSMEQRRYPNGNRPAELAASARHIVRDKAGKVEVYSREEVKPPSTKAVDLAPLNPPPYEELSSRCYKPESPKEFSKPKKKVK